MTRLQSVLQDDSQWMPVIEGSVFICVVLALARGIDGEIEPRGKRT